MDKNNKVIRGKKETTLSQRVRSARKEAHISQAALAYAIGVTDKSISAYEKGRSQPPFEKLQKIALITHKPLTYFNDEEPIESAIVGKLQVVEQELAEIKLLCKKLS